MEKFTQFRDRGSGIAPFLPVPTEASGIYLPFHAFLFAIRLTFVITLSLTYVLVVQWLPLGSLGRKAFLWSIFGVAGIWWIDLQIDGVRRGSLASNSERLPGPGSLIAASFTSPLDVLYLAAIFDPVFTASHPDSLLVQPLSLFGALQRAFAPPPTQTNIPPLAAGAIDLPALLRAHPGRPIVVFPECTTTNGRGVLPFAPSLLSAPRKAPIFPVSLRYTPADVTTPIPDSYRAFLWCLLSKPTHCIRVRIARAEFNVRGRQASKGGAGNAESGDSKGRPESEAGERKVLDRVGDALARLGRSQRVGLGVQEKRAFVKAWAKHRQQ